MNLAALRERLVRWAHIVNLEDPHPPRWLKRRRIVDDVGDEELSYPDAHRHTSVQQQTGGAAVGHPPDWGAGAA